jgi:type III secretory pathway component EscU
MPEWKSFRKLWVNGFVAKVINFIYSVPALILFIFFLRELFQDLAMDRIRVLTTLIENPLNLIGIYGFGVVGVLLLRTALGYITPIATLNWVIEGKFGSALNFGKIFRRVFTKKYFLTWLILLLIGFGVDFVISKSFPIETLKDTQSLMSTVDFSKLALYFVILSIIEFIQRIFIYTSYGNVLEVQGSGSLTENNEV